MSSSTGPTVNDAFASPSASTPISRHHPIAFWFFFWGEFAERCSFYGMKAVLALYLTDIIGLSEGTASAYQYRFKMACYVLPLVGGFLADRFFGKYWTIVGFSVPYVLGHFILGVPQLPMVILGLCLLAGGAGVTKPNISTLMGQTYDRKRPGQDQLRVEAFMWFYVAINIGAFLSSIVVPWIRDSLLVKADVPDAAHLNQHAYAMAFQFPAWVMVAALIVFAAGRKFYTIEPINRSVTSPAERQEQWAMLGRLFPIFLLIVFFWIPYEQSDVHWIYFLKRYVDVRLPLSHGVIEYLTQHVSAKLSWLAEPIMPDKFQWINPFLVLTMVPLFNWLFRRLDPSGRTITATRKMLAGFLLAAVASGLMSIAGFRAMANLADAPQIEANAKTAAPAVAPRNAAPQNAAAAAVPQTGAPADSPAPPKDGGEAAEAPVPTNLQVSLLWYLAAYCILTLGEIVLFGTALELAYSQAPKRMKSFVTACFLLTSALANFVNSFYGQLYRNPLSPGTFFAISTLLVLSAAVVFFFVARRFDRGLDPPLAMLAE